MNRIPHGRNRIRIDVWYDKRYVLNRSAWACNVYRGRALIAKGYGDTSRAAIAAARQSLRSVLKATPARE